VKLTYSVRWRPARPATPSAPDIAATTPSPATAAIACSHVCTCCVCSAGTPQPPLREPSSQATLWAQAASRSPTQGGAVGFGRLPAGSTTSSPTRCRAPPRHHWVVCTMAAPPGHRLLVDLATPAMVATGSPPPPPVPPPPFPSTGDTLALGVVT
jgi:hypothetical protein